MAAHPVPSVKQAQERLDAALARRPRQTRVMFVVAHGSRAGPRLEVLVQGERLAAFIVTSLEIVDLAVHAFRSDTDWAKP